MFKDHTPNCLWRSEKKLLQKITIFSDNLCEMLRKTLGKKKVIKSRYFLTFAVVCFVIKISTRVRKLFLCHEKS